MKRIYIAQSRRNKAEHIIYIHCHTPQACIELKQILTSHTTLTPTHTYDRYITGKAYIVSSSLSTHDIEQHIRHHVPQITSIIITRVQQRYPSTYLFDHIYFAISPDGIQYLHLIPSFTHQPIHWDRYTPPVVRMCSLCYSREHKRHDCPHLHSHQVFCANCAQPGHMARVCQTPIHCKCCGSHAHILLDCAQYKPTYTPIHPTLQQSLFPPLSRTLSHTSIASDTSNTFSLPFTSSPTQSDISSTSSNVSARKRIRINTNDIHEYDQRGNHTPLNSVFQRHLDRSSLTRASPRSSLPSRSPTPSPTPSENRITDMELKHAEDQQTITELTKQVELLTKYVQQLIQTHPQGATIMQQQQQQQQGTAPQATTTATTSTNSMDVQ